MMNNEIGKNYVLGLARKMKRSLVMKMKTMNRQNSAYAMLFLFSSWLNSLAAFTC